MSVRGAAPRPLPGSLGGRFAELTKKLWRRLAHDPIADATWTDLDQWSKSVQVRVDFMDHHMDHRLQARERLRKLSDAQRAAWLDIAEEEFRAFGFEAASLNRILTRAGISKGQAYYYFADKGELYRAVMERAFNELAGLIEFGLTEPDSATAYWQQIAGLFGDVTAALKQNDRLADLGRGIYREAKAQAAIADLLELLHGRFGRLIENGQKLGAIRSDLPLALLTNMALAAAREADRWFALNTQDLDQQTTLALNQRVFTLFTAMLAPNAGGGAAAPAATSS